MEKTSPDIKERIRSSIGLIKLINLKENPKKFIKFNSVLEDKKSTSNKSSLNNFKLNICIKSKDFIGIKYNYNYIINKINLLMKKLNKNNYEGISSLLIKIKNFINKIIPNKISTNLEISNLSNINLEKGEEHFNNYKYTSDVSITSSNEKDNQRNSYNKLNLNFNETFLKTYKSSKRLKFLERKNLDLEDKLKTERWNYLFCIGEQDKKIKELELELNQKCINKKNNYESRQYKFFPYANAKTFENIDINSERSKTQTTNISKNNFFKKQKNGKEINLIKNIREIIERGEKVLKNKKSKGSKILDKQRNYFISHPKLKYIKSDLNIKTWKTNELLDSLPKGLLKNNFSSKSQKNNLIVFPSSFNQIIVNLEKLRSHDNYKRIENEFKENRKNK